MEDIRDKKSNLRYTRFIPFRVSRVSDTYLPHVPSTLYSRAVSNAFLLAEIGFEKRPFGQTTWILNFGLNQLSVWTNQTPI